MPLLSQYRPSLRMCIVDVLRHGGGATFSGIMRRLNDSSGSIGWAELTDGTFSIKEVHQEVIRSLREGYLTLENLEDGSFVPLDRTQHASFDELHLISNSPKALKDWRNWKPPQ